MYQTDKTLNSLVICWYFSKAKPFIRLTEVLNLQAFKTYEFLLRITICNGRIHSSNTEVDVEKRAQELDLTNGTTNLYLHVTGRPYLSSFLDCILMIMDKRLS